jgi:protein-disulfide isomerase
MNMTTLKIPVTQHDHIRGPARAPITVVEYGDYECPHCAAVAPIVDQLESSFGGQMRSVFRHFPLSEVHPHAEAAAESAEFAGAAGVFWEMHEALFQQQSRLSLAGTLLIGEELGLSPEAMRSALETGHYRDRVRSDVSGGIRSGVNGTPTFFINGVRHDGAYDFESMAAAIQTRLAADSSA